MYRAVMYFQTPENHKALRSERCDTVQEATTLLDRLLALPGATGGHVEAHVPAIGWVYADEIETAVYLHRLHASDAETREEG